MTSFERDGLSFALDRRGVPIDAPATIQIDVDYDDLGVDAGEAAARIGARLGELVGADVADEEGIFDLAVSKGGALVAALVLSCEDDALALGGERSDAVSDVELAGALLSALRAPPPP